MGTTSLDDPPLYINRTAFFLPIHLRGISERFVDAITLLPPLSRLSFDLPLSLALSLSLYQANSLSLSPSHTAGCTKIAHHRCSNYEGRKLPRIRAELNSRKRRDSRLMSPVAPRDHVLCPTKIIVIQTQYNPRGYYPADSRRRQD